MYRIVFFKIPFMRGGYRVPACPFGDKPITHMSGYKVAEVVTDLAFAETQREIIVDGDTAIAADDGMANYVYIAQTNNSTIGDYTNDVRPAYYWMDDLQFVGVQGNDTPAAVVTISPDVWLTDFCSGATTVRGRLAQSTVNIATMPRTPVIQPYYNIDNTIQIDALPARPARGNNYWVVGIFAANNGGILTYAIPAASWALLRLWVNAMGAAAKITQAPKSGGGEAISLNVNCIKLYILPAAFVEYATGMSIFSRSSLIENRLESAGGDVVYDDMYAPSYASGSTGLLKTFTVNFGQDSGNFLSLNKKSWIVTPERFIELSATRGMIDGAGNYFAPASIYVSIAPSGDDGIKLFLQTGEEFIDISDDYAADFAANTAAVQQAQQKQLIALQAITSVIGAVGGAAGGVASGNYFGAVQSIAGGVQSIAQIAAARKSPAQIRGNGGVASFFAMTQTLLLAVSLGNPINLTEFQKVENEYGWQYDDAPYYNDSLEYDNYYRFAEVEIDGDITGGQNAREEIANALVSGVRLVDISKL